MTVAIVPALRPYTPDLIVMPDESQTPERNKAFRHIADANDTLRKVLKALLKERSGQTLTDTERHLIDQHIAAQKWQLEHTIIHTEQP